MPADGFGFNHWFNITRTARMNRVVDIYFHSDILFKHTVLGTHFSAMDWCIQDTRLVLVLIGVMLGKVCNTIHILYIRVFI